MQQGFYSETLLFTKKITHIVVLPLMVFLLFSFTDNNLTATSNKPTDGEKDSVKGFRNLLGNSINTSNTIVNFELNPKITPFVNDYIKKQSVSLERMKSWGQPYFMVYDRVLSSNAIPVELKYLSVVESNLQTACVSYAGAVGPWQLMADEAKRFGLKVTANKDERTDLYKSTQVAAKLLKELYNEYNDWLLVIAAYNCGRVGVNKAIAKSGSRNFYELQMYLPEETRGHVKKYIATHFFFEGSGGWTTLTAKETEEKKETLAYILNHSDTTLNANTVTFDITGKYNSVVAANVLMININDFNTLNPYFDKSLSEGKPYAIRLSQEKMDLFKAKRQQILYESVQLLLGSTSTQPITTATVIK